MNEVTDTISKIMIGAITLALVAVVLGSKQTDQLIGNVGKMLTELIGVIVQPATGGGTTLTSQTTISPGGMIQTHYQSGS